MGIQLFAGLALVIPPAKFFPAGCRPVAPAKISAAVFLSFVRDYRWLWFSSVVLVGITGVVSHSTRSFRALLLRSRVLDCRDERLPLCAVVLAASRGSLPPFLTIRWSAVLMAAVGSALVYFPVGICRARGTGRDRDDRPDGDSCGRARSTRVS